MPEPVRVPELPDDIEIQSTFDTADQVQLEVEELTLIEPVCARLLRGADVGFRVKAHAAIPPADCKTVKVVPATVMVPVRWDVEVFWATEYWTMPEPVPEEPDVIVIQLELEVAVHAQVEEEAVTEIEPVWAEPSNDADVVFKAVVHAGGGGVPPPPEPPMVIG